ncbi:hypothetical protein EJ02DRAFT_471138 [Clathrospora elynae]|uniref:Uncharacterized protein n=1 Tax=Clathrospora elynae TaxID=706981 RepID=A0A6A5S4C8_9PLEO|nr:hypothetical protein EJ02DRAFT_471138 [Clathrospora elynae]
MATSLVTELSILPPRRIVIRPDDDVSRAPRTIARRGSSLKAESDSAQPTLFVLLDLASMSLVPGLWLQSAVRHTSVPYHDLILENPTLERGLDAVPGQLPRMRNSSWGYRIHVNITTASMPPSSLRLDTIAFATSIYNQLCTTNMIVVAGSRTLSATQNTTHSSFAMNFESCHSRPYSLSIVVFNVQVRSYLMMLSHGHSHPSNPDMPSSM